MQLRIVILKEWGGKNLFLSLDFILAQVLILLFLLLALLAQRLVHQSDVYFLSLSATSLTFLSSGMSL